MGNPVVGIIIGSASDIKIASKAASTLEEFCVEYEVGIASAHRTPLDVVNYATSAAERGIRVIIAMAGLSAALPGVIAAHTTLPVVGVPIASGPLSGSDAMLSIAQMPPGVPVACMGIDGAKNAALLALRIIASGDDDLSSRLAKHAMDSANSIRQSRNGAIESENMTPVPPVVFERGTR